MLARSNCGPMRFSMMPPSLLLLLLTLVANDPELLEEFVAVNDDVAVGKPRNLTDLLFLKCIDELQIHVSVAGASVQCGALLSNPLGNGILFNHRGASSLLLLDEIRVRCSARLRQLTVRGGELLRQLGDLRLQVCLICFSCGENFGLQFFGLFLGFLSLVDEILILGFEREVAEN